MLVLLPRPQLVFEWSTPPSNLSGESSRTDVFHLTSADEGEDWGENEDDQEVATTTVLVAIVRNLHIRSVHQISAQTFQMAANLNFWA